MNLNQIVELTIDDSGMEGEGVSHIDGKTVFVPYTLKGERVRAVVKRVKPKYAVASVIKVLEPSPYRVRPDCPHYYACGGCDMAHVTAEYRRQALISELQNNFKKIAGKSAMRVSEFVSCGDGIGCRNKLSMPFGIEDGKAVLGLYRQNTHCVVPVDCMLARPLSRQTAITVRDFARKARLSVYDEKTGKGLLRHLVLREIGGRASAMLVVNGQGFDGEKELAALLPSCVDFFINPNTARGNVVTGEKARLVKGEPTLKVDVLGVKAELGPLSFFQVHDGIRDRLYRAAIDALCSPTLVDLYSGIGITSNLALSRCQNVVAVECVPQAVENANGTAALNGNAPRIKNICGDVGDVIRALASDVEHADVLVDPPRKGCGADVMRSIAELAPKTLVYISCNHATMCRDLAVFTACASGYEYTDCKIFDMFPQTHHVETLAILRKQEG